MKTSIEIKLKPFTTPNFVIVDELDHRKENGFSEARKFHLSEVDAETLSKMCDDFRSEIFKKAGKRPPPTEVQG